jgi:beta-glucosidase
MLNMKLLDILPLLAIGLLAAPACSLDPPPRIPQGDAGQKPLKCDEDYQGEYFATPAIVDAGADAADAADAAEEGIDGNGSGIDGGNTVGNIVVPIAVCNANNTADVASLFTYASGYQQDPAVLKRVQDMLLNMTLEDKVNQMRGTDYGTAFGTQMTDVERSYDVPRPPTEPKIRGFRYRDASRGMNLAEDLDGIQPSAGTVQGTPVGYSTAFPVSMARGAAFDLDLEYAIGEAIGDEMQAAKQTLLLAPCMNILRNPLWGRAQETYGEDAFLIGRLASAMAIGVQVHVAANAKHYLAYDIEEKRAANNSQLDEQTLREIFGRHFRMVVQDGGVASVMAAYNQVNGVKSTENGHILNEVLRDDFGFKGFVLSDWWAMTHAFTVADPSSLKAIAKIGVKAGLDVELPWSLNYSQLESLVTSGDDLTIADIDTSVSRILEQKFRFNADPVSGNVGLESPDSVYSGDRISCEGEHVRLARQAALESMVLLKNEGPVLPIAPSIKKVAVLSATVPYRTINNSTTSSFEVNFAKDVLTGDMGSSRVFPDLAKSVSPLDGITSTAPAGVEVFYAASADDAQAQGADFLIVMAGLTPGEEGEEYTTLTGDRISLALDAKLSDPNLQNDFINAAARLGKPMAVVLIGGSVIQMPWIGSVPAVVMAWYPGQRGGEALGRLLWGKANFGGKLPFTWSNNIADYPAFGGPGTTHFDYYLGYRYFDHQGETPLYPFGHGLSYTTFDYRKLQLGCTAMGKGAVLPVVVNVANTGIVAGDEIVMVFASFPNTTVARRVNQKELKGFARVSLQPGEEKQVTIPVRLQDLDYFQTDGDPAQSTSGDWVVESGDVKIMVGGSSTNLPLSATVKVNGYTGY